MPEKPDITRMLRDCGDGDDSVIDSLLPVVYDELKRLAESHLQRERPDHTLQATALVHEAYLRLVDQTRVEWRNRAHFFALAAKAIRRILIDHARGKKRDKRGGGRKALSLDSALTICQDETATDLLELDDALTRFAENDPGKARVVEMRFFGGLSNEETAAILGVTSRTVERHWQYARAWLYREMTSSGTDVKRN